MSEYSRSTQENLEERIARALYHEEQIQARRERESAGSKEWVEKHRRGCGAPRPAPGRDRTCSDYRVL
jgi:hypothetical protein